MVPLPGTALFALAGLLFSLPAFVHASPPPADSPLFSRLLDFHPDQLDTNAAAKRLADLDTGEPRTVRLFYFLPNDNPYQASVVQKMKDEIRYVQAWYGEQMEAHGFGYKTFRFETDDQGEPLIHRVDGQHPDRHYVDNTYGKMLREMEDVFDLSANINVLLIDISTNRINRGFKGTADPRSKQGGVAALADGVPWQTMAHELGHVFGIRHHDFRDDSFIMSYGQDERSVLSACSAGYLAVNPYFNPDAAWENSWAPAIDRLSPPAYPSGSESVAVRLRVSDADGLHQVRLIVPTRETHSIEALANELKSCHGLAGQKEAVVQFEYDGEIPSGADYGFSDLSDPPTHPIFIEAIDTDGNIGWSEFIIWEISPQHIATLEGHTGAVHSVAFSPDGTTLASGAGDGIKLWDVSAQNISATLPRGAASVAFSPDGTILAFGSGVDIELWDLATDRVFATLSGHTDPVRSLAFSPDGAMLASGAADAVRLWDLETRTQSGTLPVGVNSVAFSPDGATLASGSGDGVQLWDLATQTDVATYRHSEGDWGSGVNTVAFSPDGALVASGGGDSAVRLWNMGTGENVAVLGGHSGPVTAVAFSSDGTLLASGGFLAVSLWDPVTKGRLAKLRSEGRLANSLAFSPAGATLAEGTKDGKVGLWDVSEWLQPRPRALVKISGDDQQGTPGSTLANPHVVEVRDQYDNPLEGIEVTFSVTEGDGTLSGRFALEKATTDAGGRAQAILTLGSDPGTNTVEAMVLGVELVEFSAVGAGTPSLPSMEGGPHTWHLPDGAISRLGKGRLSRGDRGLAFSPDGQLLAVASDAGTWLYDAMTSRPVALLPVGYQVMSVAFSPDGTMLASADLLWDVAAGTHTPLEPYYSVAFSPDGTMLALGTYDSKIKLWDMEAGTTTATYEGHRSTVYSVAFSPDGTKLVSGSLDFTVRLWDVATGTHATLEGHKDKVQSVAFSPDGTTLASGSEDHTVRLWDAATGTEIATLEGHTNWVFSVAFSPDGKTLASGGSDYTVRLWDVATRTHSATLQGHTGSVRSVAFSPDGTTLASGARDGRVRLWEVATGNAATLTDEHLGWVRVLAFSPDGTRLASGYDSKKVKLWDAATGANTATLEGHTHRINAVGFSPDGTILASGSSDGTVKLWDPSMGTEIASLETHGFRNWVSDLAFSPDGTMIASGHGNGTARLWDLATGAITATLESENSFAVGPLVFSPDGETLASGDGDLIATGSSDPKVRLWDVATGTRTATFELDTDWILSISFSPEMTPVALGGTRDGTAELWDLAADTRIARISENANRSWIAAGAFSPDESIFVYGSSLWNRPTVELWDMGAETRRATLYGHGDQVNALAFSPDGTTFASGSADGTLLLWDTRLVLPHPRTLTKLSGDKQQGLPGAALARPFAVSVEDQNGEPLEGAEVTFAVTAGGGTLSTTSAATDANGRAAASLTLGGDPGRNTVAVRVADLKPVIFSATAQAVPTSLTKISGDKQEGPAGAALSEPLVVVVRDQVGNPLAGARVRFTVTAGEGILSATTDTTDANGRAAAALTLGSRPGASTVTVSVASLDPVTFTATAIATPDFDGDGDTGFSDFFLMADAFGGSDPRFDLDGSGTVDFADFFIFADHFADPARGKLLALARELIGLPDGPQLLQNAPNPFNSQTVISWFQLRPGPARVEVFALTGQRVAVLHQGSKKAGLHRVHWDGSDDRGRPLASGVYLYRLVTDESVRTRKLTLLR